MKLSLACLFCAVWVVFIVAPSGAEAQKMYKWTDENGVVHFTDTKPEGQQVEEQAIPAGEPPATSEPYATPETGGQSLAEQRRQDISRKSEQAKAERELKKTQCAALQSEVARLEPNRRVFYTNEQGETERMDDVERTDRVAELKSQIARDCQ